MHRTTISIMFPTAAGRERHVHKRIHITQALLSARTFRPLTDRKSQISIRNSTPMVAPRFWPCWWTEIPPNISDITMLVDSGATEHFVDDGLFPRKC